MSKASELLMKYSPGILTGIGIAGLLTAAVMAVKVTPKAMRLIEEHKEHDQEGKAVSPDVKEIFALTWKLYIPAALTGGIAIACIIGASSVHARRNAAMAAAFTLSETALKEYQEKIYETFGEKKAQSVRDAVAKDRIDKNPVSHNEIIITGKGETLCYDTISGRYFQSDIEKIKRIENELNHRLLSEMYLSLNEFYFELGLKGNGLGNSLGWNVSDGLLDLHFSYQGADDGTPCLVIDYYLVPRYGYRE